MKPLAFLTHTASDLKHFFPASSVARLEHTVQVVANPVGEHLTPSQLFEEAPDASFVVTEWATGADAGYFERNRELLAILRVGVEVLNIDVEAASANGVLVVNLPGIHQTSVIELTLAYMIISARKVPTFERELRAGRIPIAYNVALGLGLDVPEPGFEIRGSTVGLVGLGFIGAGLATVLHTLGARVLAYDPYATRVPDGVELVELDVLLRSSDIVSLHAKLTPETRHILGASELARMPRHAHLINTARGELVDNQALADALTNGTIAGAAVDVFDTEPQILGHPLLDAPNCIVTPHMTGNTPRTLKALADGAVLAIERLCQGEQPDGIVNPEVLDQPNLRWRKSGLA